MGDNSNDLVLFIFFSIALSPFIFKANTFIQKIELKFQNTIETIYSLESGVVFLFLVIWIYFFTLSLIIFSLVKTLIKKNKKRKIVISQSIVVKELTSEKYLGMSKWQLVKLQSRIKNEIKTLHSQDLFQFSFALNRKLRNIKLRLEYLQRVEKKQKKEQERLRLLEEERRREIEQKMLKEQELERKISEERSEALGRLRIYENFVFKKEDLSRREIEILGGEGYLSKNEFCVFEKKRISILIKTPTNHSTNHTFLVWSVKQLLNQQKSIQDIEEHLSVNADLTFKYAGEYYALEIETGNLLRKSEQLKEKIGYLKRKFPNRWIFLVSNENLAPKYAKFGPTATRSSIRKKLAKLLKST